VTIHKAEPNSIMAQLLLAFLATAGLFYVNIMPALVDGLIEGLDFTAQQAGLVASINVYGSAVGALLAVFLVRKLPWKPMSLCLLLIMMAMDILSIWLTSVEALQVTRAAHGLVGGALVGVGFAVIARTANPDRSFGMLMLVQFGFGGVGLALVPGLVPVYGSTAIFLSLIIFSVMTLMMLPFLSDYPEKVVPEKVALEQEEKSLAITKSKPKHWMILCLALLSIFLFQGALMGAFAYIFGLGLNAGLERNLVALVLGGASWVGMAGALLMVIVPTRLGRVSPLLAAMTIATLSAWSLNFSHLTPVFVACCFLLCLSWSFVTPYLFGICSEFDEAGTMAALGGFASKMGLATGPLLGAFLLRDGDYSCLIIVVVVGLISALLAGLLPAYFLDAHPGTSPESSPEHKVPLALREY
jgi:predicted MFS family arabinose efflux permease